MESKYALVDLDVGAPVIVRARGLESNRPPKRGTIVRVATSYLWVRIDGIRDNLRAARSTGRGTLHSISYQVSVADPVELERMDKADAVERLRAAIYVVNERCRRLSALEALSHLPLAEIQDLDRRLRAIDAGECQNGSNPSV